MTAPTLTRSDEFIDAEIVDENDPAFVLTFNILCNAIERRIVELQNIFYNDPEANRLQRAYGDMLVKRNRGQ